MFGEQESESPRLPSPWLTSTISRSSTNNSRTPSPFERSVQLDLKRFKQQININPEDDGDFLNGDDRISTIATTKTKQCRIDRISSSIPLTRFAKGTADDDDEDDDDKKNGTNDDGGTISSSPSCSSSLSSLKSDKGFDDTSRRDSGVEIISTIEGRRQDGESRGGSGEGDGGDGNEEPIILEWLQVGEGGQTNHGLMPEVDDQGHIEYKLKLLHPTSLHRLERLRTQLKFRLIQGGGIAIYELGILDNGTLVGLVEEEMKESLRTLGRMLSGLGGGKIRIQRVVRMGSSTSRDSTTLSSTTTKGEEGEGTEKEKMGSFGNPFESFQVEEDENDTVFLESLPPRNSTSSSSTATGSTLSGVASSIPITTKGPTPFPSNRTAMEQSELKRSKRDARRKRRENEMEQRRLNGEFDHHNGTTHSTMKTTTSLARSSSPVRIPRMTIDHHHPRQYRDHHHHRHHPHPHPHLYHEIPSSDPLHHNTDDSHTVPLPPLLPPPSNYQHHQQKRNQFNSHPGPIVPRTKPPRPPRPPRKQRGGTTLGENEDGGGEVEKQKSKQRLRREEKLERDGLGAGGELGRRKRQQEGEGGAGVTTSLKPIVKVPEGEVRYVVEVVVSKRSGRRVSTTMKEGGKVGKRRTSDGENAIVEKEEIQAEGTLSRKDSPIPSSGDSNDERCDGTASTIANQPDITPTRYDDPTTSDASFTSTSSDLTSSEDCHEDDDDQEEEEGWSYLEFDLADLSQSVKAKHFLATSVVEAT